MLDAGFVRFNKMIHVYTGEGEGKTLSALGLAMRAIGHGKRVVVIQFMKGREDTGEYLIAERLSPGLEFHQFGREDFVDLDDPDEIDFKLAERGVSFMKSVVEKKPDLLILDEINLAIAVGLVKLDTVLDFLDKIPGDMTVVLTGRGAHKEIVNRADLATEMRYIKHPFERGIEARRGLDY